MAPGPATPAHASPDLAFCSVCCHCRTCVLPARRLRSHLKSCLLSIFFFSAFLFVVNVYAVLTAAGAAGSVGPQNPGPPRHTTRQRALAAWAPSSPGRRPLISAVRDLLNLSGRTETLVPTLPRNNVSRSHSLWPQRGPSRDDRVLAQMAHVPRSRPASRPARPAPYKRILLQDVPEGVSLGAREFVKQGCAVHSCVLETHMDSPWEADAVVVTGDPWLPYTDLQRRPQHQVWVLYLLESPLHTPDLSRLPPRLINWTATYRPDSTLAAPYEKLVTNATLAAYNLSLTGVLAPFPKAIPRRNSAAGKSRAVAWFVSNCAAQNGRYEYATELAKYIGVDIFGLCGTHSCPRATASECFDLLKNTYKFYLAFENSNCRHYITEKFFVNALRNDVIPIVMGARRADYEWVAPPHSFIHIDDFESPKDLANYLHLLDNDDNLYNEYFEWKGTLNYINTKFYCRLCSMLHESRNQGVRTWYEDINKWWHRPGECLVAPTSERYKWASWRMRGTSDAASDKLRHLKHGM